MTMEHLGRGFSDGHASSGKVLSCRKLVRFWPREFRAHHAPIAGVAGGSQTCATMGPDGKRSMRGKDTFITSLLQIFTVFFWQ